MTSAVLMPNWIGDLLLALSVVERKKRAGQCDLSLIVPEKLVGLTKLLSTLPVIPYRRGNGPEYFRGFPVQSFNTSSPFRIFTNGSCTKAACFCCFS